MWGWGGGGVSVWLYLIPREFVLVGMLFRANEWACVRACVSDANDSCVRAREQEVGNIIHSTSQTSHAEVWGDTLWLFWWKKWRIVLTKEQHSSVGILGYFTVKLHSIIGLSTQKDAVKSPSEKKRHSPEFLWCMLEICLPARNVSPL